MISTYVYCSAALEKTKTNKQSCILKQRDITEFSQFDLQRSYVYNRALLRGMKGHGGGGGGYDD